MLQDILDNIGKYVDKIFNEDGIIYIIKILENMLEAGYKIC